MDLKELEQSYTRLYHTVLSEHEAVFAAMPPEDLKRFIEHIIDANQIFVYGAGREGIAARSFAMRLMHLGKEVHWLWDDTTPGMHEGDLFLVVNGGGSISHINCIMANARAAGAKVVAVTGSPSGDGIKLAHDHLFVRAAVYKGTDPVVPSVQPMGNLFEQHLFMLFDIVIMLAVKELGLDAASMERRHRNIE